MANLFDVSGQGLLQLTELMLAFVLSVIVGIERELRHKSAGLRVHCLVGVSSALFMLISKYGFMNILLSDKVVLDPSRIAAQIVSGIGFIGGGVIFMRRDVVRGLTTAASVWLTAALGMACGAGLCALAVATTVMHFIIMIGFPKIIEKLPNSRKSTYGIFISYEPGQGILREILILCTTLRFAIERVSIERAAHSQSYDDENRDFADQERVDVEGEGGKVVNVSMSLKGKRPISHLIARISDVRGVRSVSHVGDGTDLE